MIAFIDEHREEYGVEPICKVLPIAPSTYRNHVAKGRGPTRRSAPTQRDAALKEILGGHVSGGSRLGLSIVQATADRTQATLTLRSLALGRPNGFAVVLQVPVGHQQV